MKKIVMLGLAGLISAALMAQENRFDPAKMAQTRAEQLAKTLELKGDAKINFEHLYTQYFVELMGKIEMPQMPTQEQAEERRGKKDKKEEMTEEEANKKIQEAIERQEKQVQDAQRRLDVTKKYVAEFLKTLTPQQVAKVLDGAQQRQRMGQIPGGGRMGGGMGGNRGGFGGGFGGPQGGF